MSHAHALDLDHDLAFTDAAAGRESLASLIEALDRRPRRWAMIVPGHDRPFLVTDGLRERVGLPRRDAGRV
jgi:glyoxylase-like metal-dependent hydrolase (beta-lactamase superfamily II)